MSMVTIEHIHDYDYDSKCNANEKSILKGCKLETRSKITHQSEAKRSKWNHIDQGIFNSRMWIEIKYTILHINHRLNCKNNMMNQSFSK